MSEIRSVSVHLDADIAGYVAKMRLAGAETDKAFGRSERGITLTNAKLGQTETELGKVSASTRKLGSDMDSTRVKVDNGARSLDRYSGRLGIWLDLLLGLGPALVPIGAVAVPAIFALGTGALAAGAAFGVAKLAFHGVGDALKAVNTAALEPTTENLAKAQAALDALTPSARDFVSELQGLRPELRSLQTAAADGLLPGVGEGLQELTGDLPIIRRGIHDIAAEMGGLAADTGAALASDRWQPFLEFVGQQAPISLGVMGKALGAVTHGLAELTMGFLPATQDLERGILNVARDFDKWASSVGKTQGFQDFLAYINENGPRVMDLLGATADTFIDISRAAAPLGGPILDSLTLFLRVIDAIAKSDLGTPLFAGLIAIRLMSRATQLWGQVGETSAGQFIAGQRAAVSAIRSTTTAEQQAVLSAEELAVAQRRTSAGWATLRGGALKAGAAGAGIGLIASGLTDKLHLTNTATLALAGSMAGPWGAAIGGGIGLLLDFTHHQDNSAAATTDFTSTLNQQTGALTANTKTMAAQALQQDGALDSAEKLGISTQLLTNAALGHADAQKQLQAQLDLFTGVTAPQYMAGGKGIAGINQENALTAGRLQTEFTKVSGTIQGNQKDFRQLSTAIGHNSATADRGSEAHRKLAASMRAERTAAVTTGQEWLKFGDNLDDSKVSLNDWIKSLQRQANALANFGRNALRAANRGLRDGLIKQLNEAGPAGALRMKQLADGTEAQIHRANAAWDSQQRAVQSSAAAIARAIAGIPQTHSTRILADGSQALAAARAVAAAIAAVRSKTITLTTVRATGGRSIGGQAEGGTVPGPRLPYGDKVISALAPGEEVISNRHGEADRFRADRSSGRIPAYADGGTVTTTRVNNTSGGDGLGPAAAGVTGELHRLQHSLQGASDELDKERQKRQNLIQARSSLVSTVRGNFQSAIFGAAADSIWDVGSSTDPAQILRNDIRDAKNYSRDLRRLRRRGLRGGALAQVTSLADAQQALGLSGQEDRQVSRLFSIRQRAAQAAATTAGNLRFGAQIAEQTEIVRKQAADVHHLNRQIAEANHHLAAIKKAQENHGKDHAKALNGATATGVRRARP